MEPATSQSDCTDTTPIINDDPVDVDKSNENIPWLGLLTLLFHITALVIGVSLFVTSSVVYVNFHMKFGDFVNMDGRGFSEPIFFSMAFGGLLVFASIIGILMFLIRNVGLQVLTFAFGLALVLLALLSCYSGGRLQNNIDAVLYYDLENSMKAYPNNQNVSEHWDKLQSQLHCCGVQNYTDWEYLLPSTEMASIPASCYKTKDATADHVFKEGCALVGTKIYKSGYWTVYMFVLLVTAAASLAYPVKIIASVLQKLVANDD